MALFISSSVISIIFIILGVSCYRGQDTEDKVKGYFKCTPKRTDASQDHTTGYDSTSSQINTSPITTTVCEQGMEFCYNGIDFGCATPDHCACNLTSTNTTISAGGFYVNPECTERAHCINGNVTWDDVYSCSPNALCEEQNNVRQCYCKAGYHGDGQTCEFSDCKGVYDSGYNTSGIYTIKPTNWTGSPFTAYCNMADGGGWTVFQRRVDGSVDFYRNWKSYKEGFGELQHEFWLGNDKLYYLTNQGKYQLRIDLVNREGTPYYAKYDLFRINDENDNYRLSELGSFDGTAANDAMHYHFGQAFSTHDRDNDDEAEVSCASERRGAWWYKSCCSANLNGKYNAGNIGHNRKCCGGEQTVCWRNLPGPNHNIKYTEMKIRPV
ncbi:fibrinogen-like protein A isoform X2 [Apostichopus japonicus]|uniref:fibrinogen-like protein A isoform X2 n=1 Tax=Stichopus japonicus TaxID=307972 RepID=UPI003AB443DD